MGIFRFQMCRNLDMCNFHVLNNARHAFRPLRKKYAQLLLLTRATWLGPPFPKHAELGRGREGGDLVQGWEAWRST